MNVRSNPNATEIEKKQFILKSIKKDGLVLQIHHTINFKGVEKRKRFIYSAFDKSGLIVANADVDGNVFIVDFTANKIWSLPTLNSCSVLIFSRLHSSHLIIGTNDGQLRIINIHLGTIICHLPGHNYPVTMISFAGHLCLTASLTQAIIYDIKKFCKIHELTVESPTTLKQIFFMPVTNHIMACFSDDYIHIWKNKTFESFKKLLPVYKFTLRCIAVTRNGTKMVLGGIASKLLIYSLDSWELTKILNLSEEITVKSIDFMSQSHDGGANKFLILLACNGMLHFLDMEQNFAIAKIHLESEISSFASSSNGTYLACVLKSGEVNIYKLSHFIKLPTCGDSADQEVHGVSRKKTKLFAPHLKQSKEELNINKLQGILKEFGEYPEAYRSLIWSKILVLPNNFTSFETIIKKGYNKVFNDIDQKYPLVNRGVLKNLKRLLSNLGNWCVLFCHIDFLPLFVFPFIKIFENEPIVCFEAVMTIILNWCQHWFEYTPCAPINILAIIENVVAEHDPQLLAFFASKGVTSHIYAWPLLQTAFSEILTNKEWCIIWDHILSNEPSFMIMVTIAYNILCRSVLGTLSTTEEFILFYRTQGSVGIRKLISKSYYLLSKTSEKNHPRQYLINFNKLPSGSYPIFDDFCKVLLNFETDEMVERGATEVELDNVKTEIAKLKEIENTKQRELKIKEEETRRLQKLEDMYHEKLEQERERGHKRKIELSKLKTNLMEMQAEAMEVSRQKIEEINLNDKKRELDRILKHIEYTEKQGDLDIQRTEEDISKHYMELLKQKELLENLLVQKNYEEPPLPNKHSDIEKQNKQIREELEKIRTNTNLNRIKNKVSIPFEISIANDLTENMNMALAREMAAKKIQCAQNIGSTKITKMESDTKDLENDIQELLDKFTNARSKETNYLLGRVSECVCDRKKLIMKDKKNLQGYSTSSVSSSSSDN